MPDAKAELSLAALEKVLETEAFRAAPQLQKFLRYVVEEELAGRGEQIKAYNIAVDALGRPESFDAQTDPAVRVQAGRLRQLLTAYYADEGRDDPVRIELPKGTYRPVFHDLADLTGGAPASGRSSKHGLAIALVSAVVLLAIAGIASVVMRHTEEPPPGQEIAEAAPIVEVWPFENHAADARQGIVEGLRQQLISDLSHFRSIRVRAGAPKTSDQGKFKPARYRIEGTAVETEGRLQFTLTTLDTERGTLIWSRTFFAPVNDNQFHSLLSNTVRSIVTQLASAGGVLQADAMRRLSRRLEDLGDENTSAYECVLLFHVYDLNKRPEDEASARECLKRLTGDGSKDGAVWAAWSFMQFLDWTKKGADKDDPLLFKSLEAARHAIRLDPAGARGHEYLGSILMAQGARAEALKSYQRALELNPSNPDLYVLFGWQMLLDGNWTEGMESIRLGISLVPAPPGWMRIPLSIDAFRRDDFRQALNEAEAIIQTGDTRGYVLALAAAIALDETELVSKYQAAFRSDAKNHADDPMREIRNVFDSPEILKKYEHVLAREDLS